jgi:hypothetical protein
MTVIRTVEDGDATTVIIAFATSDTVTASYIIRRLPPDAYQMLMRDVDAAIDDDLVEATAAAWCAMQG